MSQASQSQSQPKTRAQTAPARSPKSRQDPAEAQRLSRQGAHLLHAQNLDAAEAAFMLALVADPSADKAWLGLGECRVKQREYAGAIPCYLKVLEHDPKRVEAWVDLGELYLRALDYDKAAAALRQALVLDPDCKHPHGVRARSLVAKTIAKLRG